MGGTSQSRTCQNALVSDKLCKAFPGWFSSSGDHGFTIDFKKKQGLHSSVIHWVFQMHADGTYSVRGGKEQEGLIWLTPLEDNGCHFCLEGYGESHRVRVKIMSSSDQTGSSFVARVDVFDKADGSRVGDPKTFVCT